MPELQEDLQALADRRAAESAGDFDSVLTTAKTRKRRRTAGLTVIGAAAVVGAVAIVPTLRPASNTPVAESPVPTNAVVPPQVSTMPSAPKLPKAGVLGLKAAKSVTTLAGGQFVATFPDKQVRAVTFSLASASTPEKSLYTLVAKIPGDPTTPYAIRMTGEMGIAIPSFSSAGPYTLGMPKGLPAGSYRVCTLSGALLCGLVTVS
ncbi:hypothetical protein [Kribbella speibonae]|uniref:Uncharacterized protein n=1 Tax=Kribbella speibonae TaxID=1572660 RepID=A0A4R0J6N7_9ACTN|nr:hypothetical protein [Kribbella speibonae]TCC20914.1 hypothetical protein E0H58_26615 [Kribbella speibonae]TCC40914.1 hypothetical protein E0H92_04325 [Kribbella speibonae]